MPDSPPLASGWLRRWGPLLLLLLVPMVWFPGALPGPRVVSADDHLSVHHAFGDPALGRVANPQLSDAAMQFGALRGAVIDALRRGEAPLWNPTLFAGAPLAADAQSAPGSPLTWVHGLLPEDQAQDLDVGGRLLIMGLGMALVALRLGAGPWGGLVAGTAAMTSPFLSVWLLHPHAAVWCWLPWLLLGVEARSALGVALAVALMVAGGHPGTLVHGLGFGAGWWLLRGRSPRVVLGVGLGLAMSAPLWAVVVENGLHSTTAGARGGGTLPLAATLDLAWPGFWGHPSTEDFRGSWAWANGSLHPGLGALGLALLGTSHRLGRWLWVGFGVAVLLACSGLLPGPFDHSRLASEGALLLALAAGLGARRLGPLVGLLSFGLVLTTGLGARWWDQASLPPEAHDPPPAAWVEVVRQEAGCPEARAPGCGRVLGLSWVLQPNTGARVGLRDVRGYDLPVSQETQTLMAAFTPRPQGPWYPVDTVPPLPLLHLTGVRVLLAPAARTTPAGLEAFDEIELPTGASVRAWRVPQGPGSAWWAPGARSAPGDLEERARRGDWAGVVAAPRVEGALSQQGARPGAEAEAIDVIEATSGTRLLSVAGGPGGVAVLSESWSSGWVAEIDGKLAPVLRVEGVFLGVDVEAGAQQVVLAYRPAAWRWGWWAAGLGWLGWLGLVASRLRCQVFPVTQ